MNVHGNIVYNWTNPNWASVTDHRAYGFVIGDLNPATTNSFFQDNIIQQPVSGFVGYSYSSPPLTIASNTYYSAETDDPPATWSQGWFDVNGFGAVSSSDWASETGDTDATLGLHVFTDPNRDIASYHASIGGGASFDAFIAQALLQSRLSWDDRYTADAVNTWVRTGFALTYQQ